MILDGDFNLILNKILDSKNYVHTNSLKSRSLVYKLIEILNLKDIFREYHTEAQMFSWWRKLLDKDNIELTKKVIKMLRNNMIVLCTIQKMYTMLKQIWYSLQLQFVMIKHSLISYFRNKGKSNSSSTFKKKKMIEKEIE